MCVDSIKLGLGRRVASSWERAAHSVNHDMFSYVYL